MNWKLWTELGLGLYLLGYTVVTVYLRAKDINKSKESYSETYSTGLLWPLALPIWIVEFLSQGLAKYMFYRDAKARQKKLNNIA